MEEQRYLISEASRKTGTEAHVLRYWEEELALKIPRNELGHRYYTESHIELFQEIQELKNKGYSLKAIRDILVGNELVGEEDLVLSPFIYWAVEHGTSVFKDLRKTVYLIKNRGKK